MPQTARPGVAPLDLQPRWPEGYIAVLREAGAQEKTIPFGRCNRRATPSNCTMNSSGGLPWHRGPMTPYR